MHNNKRNFALMAIAIMSLAMGAAYADNIGSQNLPMPVITRLAGEGSGLAVNAADATDFGPIKIVAAKLNAVANGNSTEVERGAINFNDENLKLSDLVLGNSSISGNINRNGTQVGSLSISSVVKNGKTFWYGTMTLDGKTYNLYIVGLRREIKAEELKHEVQDFCENNPTDARCMGGLKGLCNQNPDSENCKQIFRESCIEHPGDERCRTAFQDFCHNNSTVSNSTACQWFADNSNKPFCETHPNNMMCNGMMERIRGRGMMGIRGGPNNNGPDSIDDNPNNGQGSGDDQ